VLLLSDAVADIAVTKKIPTGIEGLDQILYGGLPQHRFYLVEGLPGNGKTTMALQFLLEGRAQGERVLYVTLSETKEELREVAKSHGWTLDGIDLYELDATIGRFRAEDEYSVFQPEEVELGETVQQICDWVEKLSPARVVFDSLSELRLLARDPLRHRRQMLALKQFFTGRNCTVLLLDDISSMTPDLQLRSISHGVISLDRPPQDYGVSRRRLNVVKLRGAPFRDGYHDYTIETGGVRIFPRLVAAEHRKSSRQDRFASDVEGLDKALGGGLMRGSSTLVIGPAGAGKSSIAGLFLKAASARGDRSACYIFEESRNMFLHRMRGMGLDLEPDLEAGRLSLQQIDPAELSPGQFAYQLRGDVEERGAKVVVIDSVNGYLNAMPNERFLMVHLHEVLSYLAERGVVTLLVLAQQGLVGQMESPVDLSYLADSLIVLRFFEHKGALRRALSVVKNRGGEHEDTIRELRISPDGVFVGEVLRDFSGLLKGSPVYMGPEAALLSPDDES
jgi:circadian clock protein KaiC